MRTIRDFISKDCCTVFVVVSWWVLSSTHEIFFTECETCGVFFRSLMFVSDLSWNRSSAEYNNLFSMLYFLIHSLAAVGTPSIILVWSSPHRRVPLGTSPVARPTNFVSWRQTYAIYCYFAQRWLLPWTIQQQIGIQCHQYRVSRHLQPFHYTTHPDPHYRSSDHPYWWARGKFCLFCSPCRTSFETDSTATSNKTASHIHQLSVRLWALQIVSHKNEFKHCVILVTMDSINGYILYTIITDMLY